MKVSELSGAMLDYWVAKAEGIPDDAIGWSGGFDGKTKWERCLVGNYGFCPSRNWEHGGPIIDKLPRLRIQQNQDEYAVQIFADPNFLAPTYGYGSTILIAAMRAYVASKYGNEVPAHPAAQQEEG